MPPPRMRSYVLQDGDYWAKLAHRFHFDPDTTWRHPLNRNLRTLRHNPHVLAPGDTIHFPEPPSATTQQPLAPGDQLVVVTTVPTVSTQLVLKGRLRQPQGDLEWTARFYSVRRIPATGVGGTAGASTIERTEVFATTTTTQTTSTSPATNPTSTTNTPGTASTANTASTTSGTPMTGRTGNDGVVQLLVPVTANEVDLTFANNAAVLTLKLGRMPPINTANGVPRRLNNLGYYDRGIPSPRIGVAIADFQNDYRTIQYDRGQREHLITETGWTNRATQTALVDTAEV